MALEEQITAAIAAHAAWKVRLAHAITYSSSEFAVEIVRQDNQCPFGKWLYEIDPALRRSPDHEMVRTFHANFHSAAAGVLALALAGKQRTAEAAMEPGSEFARTSMQLTLALTAWQRA
jgi:Chemoreceptor zinc-binding domain